MHHREKVFTVLHTPIHSSKADLSSTAGRHPLLISLHPFHWSPGASPFASVLYPAGSPQGCSGPVSMGREAERQTRVSHLGSQRTDSSVLSFQQHTSEPESTKHKGKSPLTWRHSGLGPSIRYISDQQLQQQKSKWLPTVNIRFLNVTNGWEGDPREHSAFPSWHPGSMQGLQVRLLLSPL